MAIANKTAGYQKAGDFFRNRGGFKVTTAGDYVTIMETGAKFPKALFASVDGLVTLGDHHVRPLVKADGDWWVVAAIHTEENGKKTPVIALANIRKYAGGPTIHIDDHKQDAYRGIPYYSKRAKPTNASIKFFEKFLKDAGYTPTPAPVAPATAPNPTRESANPKLETLKSFLEKSGAKFEVKDGGLLTKGGFIGQEFFDMEWDWSETGRNSMRIKQLNAQFSLCVGVTVEREAHVFIESPSAVSYRVSQVVHGVEVFSDKTVSTEIMGYARQLVDSGSYTPASVVEVAPRTKFFDWLKGNKVAATIMEDGSVLTPEAVFTPELVNKPAVGFVTTRTGQHVCVFQHAIRDEAGNNWWLAAVAWGGEVRPAIMASPETHTKVLWPNAVSWRVDDLEVPTEVAALRTHAKSVLIKIPTGDVSGAIPAPEKKEEKKDMSKAKEKFIKWLGDCKIDFTMTQVGDIQTHDTTFKSSFFDREVVGPHITDHGQRVFIVQKVEDGEGGDWHYIVAEKHGAVRPLVTRHLTAAYRLWVQSWVLLHGRSGPAKSIPIRAFAMAERKNYKSNIPLPRGLGRRSHTPTPESAPAPVATVVAPAPAPINTFDAAIGAINALVQQVAKLNERLSRVMG
jgi:hypothetical protein